MNWGKVISGVFEGYSIGISWAASVFRFVCYEEEFCIFAEKMLYVYCIATKRILIGITGFHRSTTS